MRTLCTSVKTEQRPPTVPHNNIPMCLKQVHNPFGNRWLPKALWFLLLKDTLHCSYYTLFFSLKVHSCFFYIKYSIKISFQLLHLIPHKDLVLNKNPIFLQRSIQHFFCNVSLNTHGLTSAYASNYLLMITFKILLLHFTYLGMYVIFLYLCWKVSLLYIVENNIFNQ